MKIQVGLPHISLSLLLHSLSLFFNLTSSFSFFF